MLSTVTWLPEHLRCNSESSFRGLLAKVVLPSEIEKKHCFLIRPVLQARLLP